MWGRVNYWYQESGTADIVAMAAFLTRDEKSFARISNVPTDVCRLEATLSRTPSCWSSARAPSSA